ncbi:uncharacterized protein LOC125668402 isoform X2 [Ostrea edulis]|uniref:uncharacterized protein LOC125668402 isoform X2 n=1 Tax=Ostrea edulis TaxID=37623 RepID=UPI0024AF5398|nr:uncharacterized protein LOC125668402 isoform X2 [Ostrea edulis]
MLKGPGPTPYVKHGQGKTACTILTEDGCIYPVISSLSYNDRTKSVPHEYGRGARPMHRSTLTIAKPPWSPEQEFKTTSKQYFSGSKSLNPVRRPPLCPSMHRSQWTIGHNMQDTTFDTEYSKTYFEKDIVPANRLHLTSLVNRIDQTEGKDMKTTVHTDPHAPTYWSQYNRVHGKLGQMRGPGVERERAIRQSYNIFTGEETGTAWKCDNKRISGNRVLVNTRESNDWYLQD